MEQWKEIIGYETMYEVSNLGNVRSIERVTNNGKKRKGKILKPSMTTNGYLTARLCKDGKSVAHSIHRLVAIHFVSNPDGKPYVNHKDGVKINNLSENLEWSTPSENIQHANRTGLRNQDAINEAVRKAVTKITPEQKQWIKDNYIRGDKEFGRKALAIKFNVHEQYITIIANSKVGENATI